MGHPNYGKDFENIIKDSMLKVDGIDVQRLYDTTNGYVGVKQPSDFIAYRYPHQYYIECKCTWENTLHKSYITQLSDLLKKSEVYGVVAGVFIWFIKHDVTVFIEAEDLVRHFENHASVNIKDIEGATISHYKPKQKKKRVFFDYDLNGFFDYFD